MTRPTLLVLAAGMGSRYGGLKQMDGVGPGGETIMDYSVYDAERAGFGKLVFVIRRDFEADFREHVVSKYERLLPTECVFQDMDYGLGGFEPPAERAKPWGTAHAVLVAREAVAEPFAVVNADDFYGAGSFKLVVDHLATDIETATDYALVGFELGRTLSDHGHVSRGICEVDGGGWLRGIVEHTKIEKRGDGATAAMPDGRPRELTGGEIVSMNMWVFQPSIFDHIQTAFAAFLAKRGDDPKAECYLPNVVDQLLWSGQARVRVLMSPEEWIGVTYREDRDYVVGRLEEMATHGRYPRRLFDR